LDFGLNFILFQAFRKIIINQVAEGLVVSKTVVPNLFLVAEHLGLKKNLAEHFYAFITACGTPELLIWH
jgi:hypothetical protein